MKKRNGFVSNSSSSSFIIKKRNISVKKFEELLDFLKDSDNQYHNSTYENNKEYDISTMTDYEEFSIDHAIVLKYLHEHNIKYITTGISKEENTMLLYKLNRLKIQEKI
jgi:hypothetical protein